MKSARLLILASFVPALAGLYAAAQQPDNQAAPTPATAEAAPAIPPGQQATREQIVKLFEVLRLRKQMQAMFNLMPQMIQREFQSEMQEINSKRAPGTLLDPAAIAETYWHLAHQHPSAWTMELEVRPFKEKF